MLRFLSPPRSPAAHPHESEKKYSSHIEQEREEWRGGHERNFHTRRGNGRESQERESLSEVRAREQHRTCLDRHSGYAGDSQLCILVQTASTESWEVYFILLFFAKAERENNLKGNIAWLWISNEKHFNFSSSRILPDRRDDRRVLKNCHEILPSSLSAPRTTSMGVESTNNHIYFYGLVSLVFLCVYLARLSRLLSPSNFFLSFALSRSGRSLIWHPCEKVSSYSKKALVRVQWGTFNAWHIEWVRKFVVKWLEITFITLWLDLVTFEKFQCNESWPATASWRCEISLFFFANVIGLRA